MKTDHGTSDQRQLTFSLRSVFVATTVCALLLAIGLALHKAWQSRDIVTAIQPNFSVSLFDGQMEAVAEACPSVKEFYSDHRSNMLIIVCEFRHSAAARQELAPYIANPQLLKTAELLDLPLSQVVAMSKGG